MPAKDQMDYDEEARNLYDLYDDTTVITRSDSRRRIATALRSAHAAGKAAGREEAYLDAAGFADAYRLLDKGYGGAVDNDTARTCNALGQHYLSKARSTPPSPAQCPRCRHTAHGVLCWAVKDAAGKAICPCSEANSIPQPAPFTIKVECKLSDIPKYEPELAHAAPAKEPDSYEYGGDTFIKRDSDDESAAPAPAKCLATPCNIIDAKNEERGYCCDIITKHCSPDLAKVLIDEIHRATEPYPDTIYDPEAK